MAELTVILKIIEVIAPLIVALMSVYLSNRLVAYRVDQLEKKVEKHNNVVERMALMEHDNDTQWRRIDELREEIRKR